MSNKKIDISSLQRLSRAVNNAVTEATRPGNNAGLSSETWFELRDIVTGFVHDLGEKNLCSFRCRLVEDHHGSHECLKYPKTPTVLSYKVKI